jgi:hypothetical protein
MTARRINASPGKTTMGTNCLVFDEIGRRA